jgi:hypothetical protein
VVLSEYLGDKGYKQDNEGFGRIIQSYSVRYLHGGEEKPLGKILKSFRINIILTHNRHKASPQKNMFREKEQ